MEYEVLSPRGDVDPIEQIALNPRVTDLSKVTVGLFTTFKEHWVAILDEIAKQLEQRYPGIKFSRFQYTKDLNSYTQVAEVAKDPDVRPEFEEWVKGVDTVIVANADAGSCTLYLAFNAALPELLGKPTMLTVNDDYILLAQRAAALRGVPALRYVRMNIPDIAPEPDIKRWIDVLIPERVREVIDDVVVALTMPLTPEEEAVPENQADMPRVATRGSLREVNKYLYRKGWAYGMPVLPPTEEAVREMLTGTDLPPDHVVAKIPPMMGKATVEKIAVNAVMAGCLPTHMPLVIAAIEAMIDPRMWIEAYTCSVASWAPMLVVNGPVRKDLNLSSGPTALSPYRKGNAAVAHAIGLIVMNLGDIKANREDMALFGHEGRFGMCLAENEEESPWEPLHVYYGLQRDDSAVSVWWPNTRNIVMLPRNPGTILQRMCDTIPNWGADPGCAIILTPQVAQCLHSGGLSRRNVVDYLVEYARIPASSMNMRWMIGHHHEPPNVPLPASPTASVRKFWSDIHLPIIVAGGNGTAASYYAGGSHGGPVTAKIHLPERWSALVAEYGDYEVEC